MKRNSVFTILGILLGLNLLAWVQVFELAGSGGLEVTFFDVGQGDAAFIETPERIQILIDGGPSSAVLEKLGKEMPFWDRTIDLVILSHPEKDHMAGLLEVLKSYKVDNILWTGVVRDTAEYKEWQKLIKEEGAEIFIAKAGLRILGGPTIENTSPSQYGGEVFSAGRSDFNVLYPLESLEGREFKDSNNTSIVLKLTFGQTSFLFTGDITKSVEGLLLDLVKQRPIGAGVLKVGHHGSKTSTSREFVEAVSPEIAVISSGKDNSYGHPHREVLDNLAGIEILRTDLRGDVKIVSDGVNFSVR